MKPLIKSHAATQLEDELRNLFIKLYKEELGEITDEINVYGAPHIGPFSLVEREVAKDGLAVLRTTDEDAIRYLFKAWRFQNPRRGMHFLRTYLQVLFKGNHEVSQLWQAKALPYPTGLRAESEIPGVVPEKDYWLTSRLRVDIDADTVPAILERTLRTALAARFVIDVRAAKYGRTITGTVGAAGGGVLMRAGNIVPPPKFNPTEDGAVGSVTNMLYSLWGYLQRATGMAAIEAGMPVLITAEGLVKNNQFEGGALGGYTADGVASSEGIALLMRGMANAYAFDKDDKKLEYCRFLMDACCEYFFFGTRPSADMTEAWYHSWMCNAGRTFAVRGPLNPNGQLDQGGYIGRVVEFVNGVGKLTPAPETVYQVASAGSKFVWDNVFSDIVAGTGTNLDVDYYINTAGSRVFGVQIGGSFGQPIEEDSGEEQGTIVLTTNHTGPLHVSYCVSVPEVTIAYGEQYEAWPMWRKLAGSERSMAADAIHWFVDTFRILKKADPANPEWSYAHTRMLEVWRECCDQESNNTNIFKGGAKGSYNNFPLTYSYGYGVDNVDDDSTVWNVVPPSSLYDAVRTGDGYVTFTAPEMYAAKGSGAPMRYGIVFENDPLYLNYTENSTIHVDTKASEDMVMSMAITSDEGEVFDAVIFAGPTSAPRAIGIGQFMRFQQEPGDATGDKTGDWNEWTPPIYDAVPFPGRRAGLIGDSITYANTLYNPPGNDGRFAYQSFGMAGWFSWAMALTNHPLELEPGIQPDVNGTKSGYQFGIAGSRVQDWWLESFEPLPDGVKKMGPMWAYGLSKSKLDIVTIMGGTNDLAGNRPLSEVLLNIQKAAYECAADGKWVFLFTITPRTTDLLSGYTLAQQDAIRNRLLAVNEAIRNWISSVDPANIFLVDPWADLVGPNGIDPHGCVSDRVNPNGAYTAGNWKPGVPQVSYFADGLHPAVAAAQVIGRHLMEALIVAGVPMREGNALGPLIPGNNLIANPQFTVSTAFPFEGFSTTLGRAIGLGPALTDATHVRPEGLSERNNLGLGYQHGKVPDNWFFYRASNVDEESYSNFGHYTWEDLSSDYPTLTEYMGESTWTEGAATLSLVTVGGQQALRIVFTTPQTGNKNEAFVLRTNVPEHQNGPWNNYGWPGTAPSKVPAPINSSYFAGDRVGAQAEVRVSNVKGLHTLRMSMNLLSVDDIAVSEGDNRTSGAVMSGLSMGQNFWPPTLADLERFHPDGGTLVLKTPIVVAPASGPKERTYAQINIEVSLDASTGPASVSLLILNPGMYKFTGEV